MTAFETLADGYGLVEARGQTATAACCSAMSSGAAGLAGRSVAPAAV